MWPGSADEPGRCRQGVGRSDHVVRVSNSGRVENAAIPVQKTLIKVPMLSCAICGVRPMRPARRILLPGLRSVLNGIRRAGIRDRLPAITAFLSQDPVLLVRWVNVVGLDMAAGGQCSINGAAMVVSSPLHLRS
jgi:hypothetical protein